MVPDSHPLLPLYGENFHTDYERHTAEAIDLLNVLSQGLCDKKLPERQRLFEIAQLSCSLWEYRTGSVQKMTPEWQVRYSHDRQRL
ncbi:hypothetical protein FJW01_03600 [Pantoea deleyi]|uniref:Uncharacterized protein n=1 Tax=Pantoea deleyi TaxID=470932 RepID=A0A506QPU3_9GAMM|nr:hypothetical protein [Pantoea deleyi]TPV47556.1 hypothetical protein FJW01_03600 [Pantoea deleyi]